MTHLRTVARPYAKAIFSQADTPESQARWQQFLQVAANIASGPHIDSHISLPGFVDELVSWIDQWLEKARGNGLEQEEKNFLQLLAERDRLAVLPEISDFYEELLYEAQDICMVDVQSAQPLSASEQALLKETLVKKIGREVQLEISENADLMAGVIIEYEGEVIDQSLKGRLNRLSRSLD